MQNANMERLPSGGPLVAFFAVSQNTRPPDPLNCALSHDRGECLSVCHGRSDLGRVDLRARVLLRQVAVDRRHDLRTRLGDLWNRLRVSDSGCDRCKYSLRDRSGRAVSFRIAADGKVGVGTFSSHPISSTWPRTRTPTPSSRAQEQQKTIADLTASVAELMARVRALEPRP